MEVTVQKMRLKALRVNKNWTQIEFAAKLGVSPETIKKWESGKHYPNMKYMKKISELLEVQINQIFFG